jgi:hypothetical protein
MSNGLSLVTKGRILSALENATKGVISALGITVAPTLTSISPDYGMQGQMVKVTMIGTNLLSVTTITFGTGITVGTPKSQTNIEIVVSVLVDPETTLGLRDITVTSPSGFATLANGFEVLERYVREESGGGGGGGTVRVRRRRYEDFSFDLNIKKASFAEDSMYVLVSKRLEADTILTLEAYKTLEEASLLILSVDKQADISSLEFLTPKPIAMYAIGDFKKKAIIGVIKPQEEPEVELLPSVEVHQEMFRQYHYQQG